MEDTLVDTLSATEPADLSQLVRQLCREVLELRQEVARFKNARFRVTSGLSAQTLIVPASERV